MKKTNQTGGILLPLSRKEISRIETVAAKRGETADRWLLLAILGALECDEEEMTFEASKDGGGDIVLKIPKKTAARLERAAALEDLSVAAYVKDGIRRDLDLSEDLMDAAQSKNQSAPSGKAGSAGSTSASTRRNITPPTQGPPPWASLTLALGSSP
jgi:hypothetical protein